MSRLPSIFHNNDKFLNNNKNSFNTFGILKDSNKIDKKDKKEDINIVDIENIYSLFNKKVVITLKNGSVYSGVLISKRDNKILLDSSDYILISDILSIN